MTAQITTTAPIRLAYTNSIRQQLNQDKIVPIQGPFIFDTDHSTGNQADLEATVGVIEAVSGDFAGITANTPATSYFNATAYIKIEGNTNWNSSIGFYIFDTQDFTRAPIASGSWDHPRAQNNVATISLNAVPGLKSGQTYYWGIDAYSFNQWFIDSVTIVLQQG